MQAAARAPAAPWREVLQRALKANEACRHSRYVQLATVRPDGRPANRTIVYRGQLEGDNDVLTFVTDSRSRKIEEIAHSPWGEVRTQLAGSWPLACRQREAREGIGSWPPAGACTRARLLAAVPDGLRLLPCWLYRSLPLMQVRRRALDCIASQGGRACSVEALSHPSHVLCPLHANCRSHGTSQTLGSSCGSWAGSLWWIAPHPMSGCSRCACRITCTAANVG